MWVRKGERDHAKGVDSPIPTQVISNEEFIPRPQDERQKAVEALIMETGTDNAKRLGMDRRAYMASAMGVAMALMAQNKVYGKVWEVDPAEALEDAACQERYPKGKFFIIDAQGHFTNGQAPGFRNNEMMRNMGFNLKNDAEAYSFKTFVKEMYFDSDTSMVMISGLAGFEQQRAPDGRVLEGAERSTATLPSWLMARSKAEINGIAGSQRALAQGNLAPNHYWNRQTNTIDKAATLEQMDREISLYKIDSWKWYCHNDPARTGDGFSMDSDNAMWFYEESRKRGMKRFSVHKGYSSPGRMGDFANPKDVEKAALQNPDLNFIVYHSGLRHAPWSSGANWKAMNEYNAETGDFAWHNVLMDIKRRNPAMNNVYCELGSFFNTLTVADPVMAMHGMGKNIQVYGADHVIWGTDCLWWGSPQWCIEAFVRFQISDELCEKHGYKKITDEDRAKILGLNLARVYGIDVAAQRRALPADALERIRTAYLDAGGLRSNAAYGWVRAEA